MKRTPLSVGIGGLLAGLAAFVLGYAVTFAWHGNAIEERLRPIDQLLSLFQAEPIGAWRVVGWLFYSAHFVDIRASFGFGPIESELTVNLIAEGAGSLEFLYLVPPLLLVLGGGLLARWAAAVTLRNGAIAGTAIAIGYVAAAVVGLFVFQYGGVRPDPTVAILVAGLGYPILFGAVGGAVAVRLFTQPVSEP